MDNAVCANCGCDQMFYYDGMLGYEAVVCKGCNAIHDHVGVWVNDELVTRNEVKEGAICE